MIGVERCPHCHAPMAAMTNLNGRAYLQCMDCGHYEAIQRRPSPHPDTVYYSRYKDGRTRRRFKAGIVPFVMNRRGYGLV